MCVYAYEYRLYLLYVNIYITMTVCAHSDRRGNERDISYGYK